MKRVSRTNTEGTPVLNGHIEDIKPSMKTQDGVVRKVEDHRKVESQKIQGRLCNCSNCGRPWEISNIIQELKNISLI